MDGRSELLAYLGTSIVTIVALFALQEWYASYLDVAVVHAQVDGSDPKLGVVRDAEDAKLSSGKLPITQAKQLLAQRGRTSFPRIAPKASEDVQPMSGWVPPGYPELFHLYQPRTPQAPPAAEATAEGAPADANAPAAAPQAKMPEAHP